MLTGMLELGAAEGIEFRLGAGVIVGTTRRHFATHSVWAADPVYGPGYSACTSPAKSFQ